jgi:hypothetical protein
VALGVADELGPAAEADGLAAVVLLDWQAARSGRTAAAAASVIAILRMSTPSLQVGPTLGT